MLVLSRQEDQKIIFPNLGISVEVIRVKGKTVRIGIDAPRSIRIARGELLGSGDEPASEHSIFQRLDREFANADQQKRHEFRNSLNSASLSVSLAKRQMEAGNPAADQFLNQALDALTALNQLVLGSWETASPTDEWAEENFEPIVPMGQSRTALIVEDNDNERELLAGVLEMAGFQVSAVSDGQAAIDFLEANERPDVVLMDMNMPRLDGAETIFKIRNEFQQSDLSIVGVSGLTQSEANIPTGDRGVTGWFSKPINPNQLVRYLRHEIEPNPEFAGGE